MKLQFFTPSCGVSDDSFGCATFGFVGAFDPTKPARIALPFDLDGLLVTGSYEQCLSQCKNTLCSAALVVLGNAGGENAFIHELSEILNVPIVGGGAAIDPVTGQAGLITGKNQAAVFLITDDRYRYEVCCENIHHDILGQHKITFTNPRQIDQIDGVEGAAWFADKKAEFGLSMDDFEHLTFSDLNGINAHLSLVDGKLCSGRDLQEQMLLRYVPAESVFDRIQKFYDDPHGLVFGCAGLKGILPREITGSGVGLFLFGEVCTHNNMSEFGNLMLSKLRILPK